MIGDVMTCRDIYLHKDQSGMTLIEMTMAMMILLMFTSSVVMVMQFTTTFMAQSDQDLVEKSGCDADVDPETCSKGLLVDHADLQIAMDDLVSILNQPAVNVIPYAAVVGSSNSSCTRFPFTDWQLPGRELHSPLATPPRFLPPDYKFCLWRSLSRPESPLSDLISDLNNAQSGIYILQAVPAKLSPSSLPTRRLFCRPKPFC
jgi:prepilin-type N-terminal cleavage/methylation domain-containing protein